jgi:hypothetical protein
MAALYKEDKLHWIGGSNTTYNYNGIAYNGTGGVPPSNRIVSSPTGEIIWDSFYASEIPMDLRGIADINETTAYIMGGMIEDQEVTNKIYKIEFNTALGIDSKNNSLHSIEVYPNPFIDRVKIQNTINAKGIMVLYNIMGEEILQQIINEGLNEVDVLYIPKGIYMMKIWINDVEYVKKLIKKGN